LSAQKHKTVNIKVQMNYFATFFISHFCDLLCFSIKST